MLQGLCAWAWPDVLLLNWLIRGDIYGWVGMSLCLGLQCDNFSSDSLTYFWLFGNDSTSALWKGVMLNWRVTKVGNNILLTSINSLLHLSSSRMPIHQRNEGRKSTRSKCWKAKQRLQKPCKLRTTQWMTLFQLYLDWALLTPLQPSALAVDMLAGWHLFLELFSETKNKILPMIWGVRLLAHVENFLSIPIYCSAELPPRHKNCSDPFPAGGN